MLNLFTSLLHSHCINLLLTYGNGCAANCSYCGLSNTEAGKSEATTAQPADVPVERAFADPELLRRMRAVTA